MRPDTKTIIRAVLGMALVTVAARLESILFLWIFAGLGVLSDFAWGWSRDVNRRIDTLVPELEAALKRTDELQRRASERMERAEGVLARELATKNAPTKGGPNF